MGLHHKKYQIILWKGDIFRSIAFIQFPLHAYKHFCFNKVNLGTFQIEYHGLKTQLHSGYLILALLGFQFLDFRLKPFVDPMPVEL